MTCCCFPITMKFSKPLRLPVNIWTLTHDADLDRSGLVSLHRMSIPNLVDSGKVNREMISLFSLNFCACRLDCFPDSGSNEQACVARGCCWLSAETEKGDNIPWCFYSNAYQQSGYQMGSLVTINGTFKQIEATRKQPSFMPEDVMNIKLDFSYESNDRLRIKIYDPNNDR